MTSKARDMFFKTRAGDGALLTREGEVELARKIETSRVRIVETILGLPIDFRDILLRPEGDGRDAMPSREGDTPVSAKRRQDLEFIERVDRARSEMHDAARSIDAIGPHTSDCAPAMVAVEAALWREHPAPEKKRQIRSTLVELATNSDHVERILRFLERRISAVKRAREVLHAEAGTTEWADANARSAPLVPKPSGAAGATSPVSAITAGYSARLKRVQAARRTIREVERETALSADGLLALWRRVEADRQRVNRAKSDLIQANWGLVVAVAKKYQDQGMPLMDMIQEGNIGLMKVADKFNYRLGYRFSTYAIWWVRQSIARALSDKSRIIRVPVHMIEKQRRIEQLTRRSMQVDGRHPTSPEMASALELPAREVEAARHLVREPLSLQKPVGKYEDSLLMDHVADEDNMPQDDAVADRELRERAVRLLGGLSKRERRIIQLRFGIGAEKSATLKEIAEQYGLSRERIRQIESRALDKLRQSNDSELLRQLVTT